MSAVAWGAVIVAIVTGFFATIVALIGWISNRATSRNNAGELALRLAQNADLKVQGLEEKITKLEDWQSRVRTAWREHEEWDDIILDKIEDLAPGTKATMPTRPPLPIN